MSPEFRKRPMTTYGSRYAKREHKVHLDESESSDSEIDDDQIIFLRDGNKDDMFRPVKGQPGMGYKVCNAIHKNCNVMQFQNISL